MVEQALNDDILAYSNQWIPQPGAQQETWECPVEQILVAGSRGGGKSDLGLAMWWRHLMVNEELRPGCSQFCRGLVLRRTLPELKDLIERAELIYGKQAEWSASTRTFRFSNGAQIQFSYLDRDAHARNFQGRQFSFQFIEEAGLFPNQKPLDMVFGSLRSTMVPDKKIILTANPGGPGHSWLKKRFVDPAPAGRQILVTEIPTRSGIVKKERIYIPSKTHENKVLLDNDPTYEAQLHEATKGLPHLARAWIHGDWNIVAGGMFDSVWDPQVHVLPHFDEIPEGWQLYRSYDWGSARPFSIGWYAKTDGHPVRLSDGSMRQMARGSVIKLAEWYGARDGEVTANEGLNMLETDIVERVVQREEAMFPGREVLKGPADHNIFVPDASGHKYEHDWRKAGIRWKPADKERIKGWRKITEMLVNAKEERPEKPGLYFTETCHATLQFLPVAPRQEDFPDELANGYEDHVLDELRYFVMFKPGSGVSYVQVA